MKKKLVCDQADIARLLSVGLAAEGKKALEIRWGDFAAAGYAEAEVEYELLPTAPDTAQKPDLTAAMVEKMATLMEQCQLAGLDIQTEVIDPARLKFSQRATAAGRMEPATT